MEGGGKRRRADGRRDVELRPLGLEVGVLGSVDGSARWRAGDTMVLAGVQGPRPPRSVRVERPDRAVVEVTVVPATGMAGAAERAAEEALAHMFSAVIVVEAHPRTAIAITVQVLVDDGGLLPAMVNATTAALINAGVPLRTRIAGVAAGVARGGAAGAPLRVLADPDGAEEAGVCAGGSAALVVGPPDAVPLPHVAPDAMYYRYQPGCLRPHDVAALDAVLAAGAAAVHAFLAAALRAALLDAAARTSQKS